MAKPAPRFGAFKGPHHTVIDGKLTVVPRGVYACAQRLQQGAFDVEAAALPGMKRHLAAHYRDLGETPPWDRALGNLYEQVHRELAETADPIEQARLRRWAETLATDLYGPDRLREAWELPADLPGDPALLQELRAIVLAHRAVPDSEEDRPLDDTMRRLAEVVTPLASDLCQSTAAIERIRQALGIDLGEDWLERTLLAIDRLKAAATERASDSPLADVPVALDPKLVEQLHQLSKELRTAAATARPGRPSVLEAVKGSGTTVAKPT